MLSSQFMIIGLFSIYFWQQQQTFKTLIFNQSCWSGCMPQWQCATASEFKLRKKLSCSQFEVICHSAKDWNIIQSCCSLSLSLRCQFQFIWSKPGRLIFLQSVAQLIYLLLPLEGEFNWTYILCIYNVYYTLYIYTITCCCCWKVSSGGIYIYIIPDICHNRWLCTKFQSSVKFSSGKGVILHTGYNFTHSG